MNAKDQATSFKMAYVRKQMYSISISGLLQTFLLACIIYVLG